MSGDEKILAELGDYLVAHREDIIGEWLRAVEQNPDISSSDHLKDKEELADHLPELCQNLAELLKSPQNLEKLASVAVNNRSTFPSTTGPFPLLRCFGRFGRPLLVTHLGKGVGQLRV